MEIKKYENYPFRTVILANLVSVGIYVAGAYIMFRASLTFLVLYLLYIAFLEIRLLTKSCVHCYYYGKFCAFGKGKLCSVFFKKDDKRKFCEVQISWKDILPDFMVSIIPAVTGIILLISDFNWLILSLIGILVVLTTAGNGFVRGSLSCNHCKQQDLGCPAAQLFKK